MQQADLLLRINGLTKTYAGVNALSDVSLDLAAGEVHGLCGENGAGKSTLIKCLTGVTTPDGGKIEVDGRRLPFGSVAESESLGIAVIHQESTTFSDLNAIDNIFVGRELKNRFGLLDHRRMRSEAERLLNSLGQKIDITRPLSELSLANRQMIAMARAVSRNCRLLIMDEPTASLSARETGVLLQTVKSLQQQGVTILYVSHRLSEIFHLADRVTVLRDSHNVGTKSIEDLTEAKLIQLMVGRDTSQVRPDRQQRTAETKHVQLEVRNLTSQRFHDISLCVRAGEIVGLAGLIGAGRSEVARAIVGLDDYESGDIEVTGKSLVKHNVRKALDAGLALVPEDRQHEGLVLPMSVQENMSMAVVRRFSKNGIVNPRRERELVADFTNRLRIKAASADAAVESLSGGNQQKVVIGKWLATKPKVLILDEPTRGVDVGAKSQVHELIRELADDGMATLIISSELPELLNICDRILVMREGSISGEVDAATATQEQILEFALPTSEGAVA